MKKQKKQFYQYDDAKKTDLTNSVCRHLKDSQSSHFLFGPKTGLI